MAPLCLGSMLNPVNSTMISTALVAIARDFQATVAETGLLIGGLYITSAVAQPTMGRLADRLGARRVFLAGLYLIALAGGAGTFVPSLRALIWVRVLLGVGTSAAYPTAMRILRNRAAQTRSVEPRMALGILSMSALSTVAIGAALGGILTGLGGWRMVFTVNLPLSLLGILLVFLWIPEDQTKPAGLRKLPQGICSNANQAAVYVQAPHEEVGTAAGLLRTSQYVGAIVASSFLGLLFGKRPTDHGMHTLAWVMVVLSAGLVIATVADRTLPREAILREAV
jgi:MFS family permease